MPNEASKILGLTLSVAVVVALAVVWLPKLLGVAAGPDSEIITQLKRAETQGLQLTVLAGPLTSRTVLFQRLSVTVDPSGTEATVLGTLDFTGVLGLTTVSSLGVERIRFALTDGEWRPEGSLAPRLVAVVNALERRRRALEAGDKALLGQLCGTDAGQLGAEADEWLELLERKLQVDAWFIRLERDEVQVSEDYRFEGFGKDRPFRQIGPRKLQLAPAAGGEFFFPKGLM